MHVNSTPMRRLRILLWSLALCLWGGCIVAVAQTPGQTGTGTGTGTGTEKEWIYELKAGESIWTVSEQYLAQRSYWRRLQVYNRISNPRALPPGTRLRIPASWLRMEPASARVGALRGEVSAHTAGNVRRLATGDTVAGGTEIRVASEASVELLFSDGGRLVLEAETVVELEQVRSFPSLGVSRNSVILKAGGVEAELPPASRAAGSRFQIQTPAASLAVRGTYYRARLDGSDAGRTLTEVLRGEVQVQAARAQRRLRAEFGLVAEVGRPLPPPQRLLPPPQLASLPDRLDRVPMRFEVLPVPGARAYRVQLSGQPDFAALLYDRVAAGPLLPGPDLPDGRYHLRVRAIDDDGLEGFNLDREIILNARPEAPLLLAPAPDDVVRQDLPVFRWAAVEGLAGYRLQLADEPDFAAPLLELSGLTGSELTPELTLEPGVYYWRMAADAEPSAGGPAADGIADGIADGHRGPFGSPLRFTLRPAPPGQQVEPPVFGSEGIEFSWREGLPGQRYQFQLAADYWFGDLIVDEELAEPHIRVPPLPSDKYYARMRVIDSDGYRGNFGPRQEITVPLAQTWQILVIPAVLLLLAL